MADEASRNVQAAQPEGAVSAMGEPVLISGDGGQQGENNEDQQAKPFGGFPAKGTDERIKERNKEKQDGVSRKVPIGLVQNGKKA